VDTFISNKKRFQIDDRSASELDIPSFRIEARDAEWLVVEDSHSFKEYTITFI